MDEHVSTTEFAEARDEAMQKIGRNIVNFQKFEHMLKLLIARSDMSGFSTELARIQQRKFNDINRKPLGWLIDDLFRTVYSDNVSSIGAPAEISEPWMSFSFKVEADSDDLRSWKRELTELVKQRNILIHQLLPRFNLESVESCRELISLLDDQREKLRPHYLATMQLLGDLHKAQQLFLDELESKLGEGGKGAA